MVNFDCTVIFSTSYRKLGFGFTMNITPSLNTGQQCWKSWHQRIEGKAFTDLKMNYWLTTINMPRAQRPAYNIPRSILVFIMCAYWSLMKEWIIFHAAYVSAKKCSRKTVKPCRGTGCPQGTYTEPLVWALGWEEMVCKQHTCRWSWREMEWSLCG